MSTVLLGRVWPLHMTPTMKMVYISLADQANDEGVCWPSIAGICKRTCLAERTVRNALRELEKCCALICNFRTGGKTTYQLTPFEYVEPADETPAADAGEGGGKCRGEDGDRGAADAGEGGIVCRGEGHQMPEGGAPDAPKPSYNHQLTIIEPSLAAPPVGSTAPVRPVRTQTKEPTPTQLANIATWKAYANAYRCRYQADPVRNARVNGQIAELVKRLGHTESPQVAEFYLSLNDQYVVRRLHDVGTLLAQAEAIRTQWATGLAMTTEKARQTDKTQSNLSAAQEAIQRVRGKV